MSESQLILPELNMPNLFPVFESGIEPEPEPEPEIISKQKHESEPKHKSDLENEPETGYESDLENEPELKRKNRKRKRYAAIVVNRNRANRRRLCEYETCEKRATHGAPGSGLRVRCVKHKKAEMRNLNTKYCEVLNCGVTATFGYIFDGPKIERQRLRCARHCEVDMISVVSYKK